MAALQHRGGGANCLRCPGCGSFAGGVAWGGGAGGCGPGAGPAAGPSRRPGRVALDESDQRLETVERCLSVPLLPQQMLAQLHAPLQTGNHSINFLPRPGSTGEAPAPHYISQDASRPRHRRAQAAHGAQRDPRPQERTSSRARGTTEGFWLSRPT